VESHITCYVSTSPPATIFILSPLFLSFFLSLILSLSFFLSLILSLLSFSLCTPVKMDVKLCFALSLVLFVSFAEAGFMPQTWKHSQFNEEDTVKVRKVVRREKMLLGCMEPGLTSWSDLLYCKRCLFFCSSASGAHFQAKQLSF
jgi:hypothetical protein